MEDAAGARLTVRGESLGGGRVRLSSINGVAVDITGEYDTIFVAHEDARGVLARLTVLLSDYGINIAFMRTYRTARGGDAYTVFELDELPHGAALDDLFAELRAHRRVRTATLIRVPGATPRAGAEELADAFATAAELRALAAADGARPARTIGMVMREREEALRGVAETRAALARVIEVMRRETTEPLAAPAPSLGGLIGGEARRVASAAETEAPLLMGAVQTDAVARAMAVLERSASMGVIVAAPTAGSAGVVPGALLAVHAALGADDEALGDALFCAAAIGLLLSLNASVSGAEGGCQAEVGSAAAMAAAGVVELLGGTPDEALDAASLALGNLLGLVCDPVGGLVEVPCQNRNAIGVAAALSAAQLARSGVRSLVPFDEMAQVMRAVGQALPTSLRETAQGGIACAPSACAACHAGTSATVTPTQPAPGASSPAASSTSAL